MALLLAGCLGVDDTPTAEEAEATPDPEDPFSPRSMSFEDCHEHVGAFSLPASVFESSLPDNFEPQGMDPDDQTALFTLFTWSCENVLVDEEPMGSVLEMVGMVNVHPPTDLAGENASAHVAILHGVTDQDALLPAYEEWGLPIEHGEVTMATQEPVPTLTRHGQASAQAGYETVLNTNVAGPVEEREAGEARFFGVMNAELTSVLDGWWHDVPNMQEGEATLVEANPEAIPSVVPLEGLGYHYWGSGFGFGYERVPLSEA